MCRHLQGQGVQDPGDTAFEESAKCLRIHQEGLEGGNWIPPKDTRSTDPVSSGSASKGSVDIPYVGQVSDQIARLFRSRGVMTRIRPYNTIRARLVRPKDRHSMEEQAGLVYSIKCADCPASYVGETERPVAKRLKEHRRPESPVCEHMTEATDRPSLNRDMVEAGIPSPPSTASCCRHVTLVISLTTGSHVTIRKVQFAEEGPTLWVESYDLSKTLRWCERLINSIKKKSMSLRETIHSLSHRRKTNVHTAMKICYIPN